MCEAWSFFTTIEFSIRLAILEFFANAYQAVL